MRTLESKSDIKASPAARYIAILAIAVISTLVPARYGHAQPETAPDFKTGQCVNADSLALSDFFEYPVVVFLLDAGDAACFGAYPYIVNWQAKYAADEVRIIGIHSPGYEMMRSWPNVVTALARSNLKLPTALDYDREIYSAYSVDALPACVLLEPGGRIVSRVSAMAEYPDFEKDIQAVLRSIEPDIVLPFLLGSANPEARKYPPPTAKIDFGYQTASIANSDSSDFGQSSLYDDPGDMDRGKIYLEGRWKIEEKCLTYEGAGRAHMRVLYSGQDVWILADFDPEQAITVYVEQDGSPMREEVWGEDTGLVTPQETFIDMKYPVPLHVVSNPAYGTHELKIIPEEGTVSFQYLFFGPAKKKR